MLKPAILYKADIENLWLHAWFVDKYKYFITSVSYDSNFMIQDNSWDSHQFASVDADNNVLGVIMYNIHRTANYCSSLAIISFCDEDNKSGKFIFGKDICKAIKDIFEFFKFNKIVFSAVTKNPAIKHYDRLVEKYGGRVVGVFKDDVKLVDNELYDIKYYEILRSDYLTSKLCADIKKGIENNDKVF